MQLWLSEPCVVAAYVLGGMSVAGLAVVVLLGKNGRMCFRDPRRLMVVVGIMEVVVFQLGGLDRMCFRDPRRLMVVVGRMVEVVVVVQLGGVDRMCFRDPRRMMVVVEMVVGYAPCCTVEGPWLHQVQRQTRK